MKKITKIIFSCAAVAAVTASVGTAALAADQLVSDTIKGTYENGVVTLTEYEAGEGQQTILMFKGTDIDTAEDTNIEYINQGDAKFLAPITLRTGELAEGDTLTIRIGGAAAGEEGYQQATITIPKTGGEDNPPVGEGEEVVMGDINGNGSANSTDATLALRIEAGTYTATAKQTFVGDVNGNGSVNSTDATQILRGEAGYTTGIGSTGQKKTYTAAE